MLPINDSTAARARDGRSALDFFSPVKGMGSQMAGTDDPAGEPRFDDDRMGLDDARKIMGSNGYRQMRAVMPGVGIQK